MRKKIEFDSGSITVIGLSQSGKTTAVKESLKSIKDKGVFFFNYKRDQMPNHYIEANSKNSIDIIKWALKNQKKINYLPSDDLKIAQLELEYLINNLHSLKDHTKIIFIIDEVHLLQKNKDTLNELIRLSTTGLSFGKQSVWISQRPALIDNTLMTQSEKFVIFKTSMETAYMKSHYFPVEDIQKKINAGGKYAYVEYDYKEVKGPYKI